MSLTNNLAKWRKLPWADRGLLVEAFSWLALIRLLIAVLPFKWIVSLFRLKQGEDLAAPDGVLAEKAVRIGWAVRATAQRQIWDSTCLSQAVAGAVLLRRRGIHSTFYLGVAKGLASTKEMSAHAWLRCGAIILTGAAGHERFTVISSFKA
jgi:hypothetical protein